MKKLSKEFIAKIEREGGVYDTRKYRYIIGTISGEWYVERTKIENLGTTTMLDDDAWEIVCKLGW